MKANGLHTIILIILLLFFQSITYAQRDSYIFVYLGIRDSENSLSQTELRVLENRLSSFLVQISAAEPYDFLFPEDRTVILNLLSPSGGRDLLVRDLPPDWQPLARGIISGEINKVGQNLFLDLFIHNRSNGRVLLTKQDDFPDFDTLLSRLQSTTYSLFGLQLSTTPATGLSQGLAQQQTAPLFASETTMALIQGNWRGDTGIGQVFIHRDGTGTAEVGDNETMKLQVRIENNVVRVRQDEPNAPKMYMAVFPYNIATQIVGLARPMSWEFRLSSDGKRLIGNKFTSFVSVEQGTVTRVDNTYFREATWERSD